MVGLIKNIEQNNTLDTPEAQALPAGRQNGRSFSLDKRKLVGIIFVIIACVSFIFAAILASGVFGAGKMGLIAGGLAILSIFALGPAIYCLSPIGPPRPQAN